MLAGKISTLKYFTNCFWDSVDPEFFQFDIDPDPLVLSSQPQLYLARSLRSYLGAFTSKRLDPDQLLWGFVRIWIQIKIHNRGIFFVFSRERVRGKNLRVHLRQWNFIRRLFFNCASTNINHFHKIFIKQRNICFYISVWGENSKTFRRLSSYYGLSDH